MPEVNVRPSYPLVKVQSTKEVGRPAIPWGVAAELKGVDGTLQGGLRPFQGFELIHELDFYQHQLHDETSRVNYFKPIHFRIGANYYGFGVVYRAIRTRRLGGSTSAGLTVSNTTGTGSHGYGTGADLGSSTSSGNPTSESAKADIFVDFWNSGTDSISTFGHKGEVIVEGVDPNAQMDVVVAGRLIYVFVSGRSPALFFVDVDEGQTSIPPVTTSISGSTSSGRSSSATAFVLRKLGMTLAGPFPGPGRQPTCISPKNATALGDLPVPTAGVLHKRPAVGQVVLTTMGPMESGLFSANLPGEGGGFSVSGRGSSSFIDSTANPGTRTSSSFPDTTAFVPDLDYSGWVYDINSPSLPTTTKEITLTNPTLAEIQSTIDSSGGSVALSVFGTVTDINTQLVINLNHVDLDMRGTEPMLWAGTQFGGQSGAFFLSIESDMVRVRGLSLNAAGGTIGGLKIEGAEDVTIEECTFDECNHNKVTDILRVHLLNSYFTKSQRSPVDSEGGYGLYVENDVLGCSHLIANGCHFTTTGNTNEYPFRCEGGNSLIRLIDCRFEQYGSKRTLWAYGVTSLQMTRCTFIGRRVRLGVGDSDGVGAGYIDGVRIDQCIFQDIESVGPNEANLQIDCRHRAQDIKIRLCHWNNCGGAWRIGVAWRDDPASGSDSRDIVWYVHTLRVNGAEFTAADAEVDADWSSPGEPTSYNIQGIVGGAGSSSFIDSTSGLVSDMAGNSSDETSTSSSMIGALNSTLITTSSSGESAAVDSTGITTSSSSISISQTGPTPYSDPTSSCSDTSGTGSVTIPPRILADAWVRNPRPFYPASVGAPATGILDVDPNTITISVQGRARGDEDPFGVLLGGSERRAHIATWQLFVASLDEYAVDPGVLDTPVGTGTIDGGGAFNLTVRVADYITLQPGVTYLWGLRLFNSNTACGILVGNADEAINPGGLTIVSPAISQSAFIDTVVGGKYKFRTADAPPPQFSPSSDDPSPALGKFKAEKFEPGDYVFSYFGYDSKTGRKSAISEVSQVQEETFTQIAAATSELSEDRTVLYAVLELAYDPSKFDQLYVFRSVKVQDAGGTLVARNQHLEAIIDLEEYHTNRNQTGGQWAGHQYKHVCYWYKVEDKQLIYQDMYVDEPLFDEEMPKGGAATFYNNTMFVSKINDPGPYSTVDAVRVDDGIRAIGEMRWSSTYNYSPELFSPSARYVPSVPTSEVISFRTTGPNLIGFALDGLYHMRKEGNAFKAQPMHDGFGIVSQKALASMGSAIIYMTPKGLKQVTSNGELSDLAVMDYLVMNDWAGQLSSISMSYDPMLSVLTILNPLTEQMGCIWMNTLMFTEVNDAVFTETEQGVWPRTYSDYSSSLTPRSMYLQNSPGTTASDIVPGFKPRIYVIDHDRSRTVDAGNDAGSARVTTLPISGNSRLTVSSVSGSTLTIDAAAGTFSTGSSLCGAYVYVLSSSSESFIGAKAKIVEVLSTTQVRLASTDLSGLPATSRIGISPVFFQWVGANIPMLAASGEQYAGAEFNVIRQLHALGCSFVDVETPIDTGTETFNNATDAKFEALAFRGTSNTTYATGLARDTSGNFIRTIEDFESIDWAPYGWQNSTALPALGVRGSSLSPGVRIYCPDVDYRLLSVVTKATILDTERGQLPA